MPRPEDTPQKGKAILIRDMKGAKVRPYLDEASALLSISDVVRHTRFSKSKVYSLIASGNIPSVRNGRNVRVPLLSLRRWVAEQTSTASFASNVS